MFPVLSTLRRGAYNVVYVRPAMLKEGPAGLYLVPPSPLTFFDLGARKWVTSKEVPFFALSAKGKSPEATASMLVRAENDLCKAGSCLERTYTLMLGEETEVACIGGFLRVMPIAVLKGIQRMVGASQAPVARVKPAQIATYRELPKGTVVERR